MKRHSNTIIRLNESISKTKYEYESHILQITKARDDKIEEIKLKDQQITAGNLKYIELENNNKSNTLK